MKSPFNKQVTHGRIWLVLVSASTLGLAMPAAAQHVDQHPFSPAARPEPGGAGRTQPAQAPRSGAWAPAPHTSAPTGRSEYVDRSSHGSVRHSETHVVPRFDNERHFEGHGEVAPRHDFIVHHDFDAGFRPHYHYHDFAFHEFTPSLPLGFLSLQVGGAPYYYYNGIYYQPSAGGYQEVYPPVGAAVPDPPEGSIPIQAGGQTYYYAGGAFYLQQPDGTYQIAPTPLGLIVPELPAGAIQVSLGDGSVAYQFNGVYYRPVFVNGITQFQTFLPQVR